MGVVVVDCEAGRGDRGGHGGRLHNSGTGSVGECDPYLPSKCRTLALVVRPG